MAITEWIAHQYDTIIHSGFPIFFWVKPEWSTSDIPDQTGRVVLVTGGNSGTGYATCKALYEKGAKVYLCCRDTQRGKEAIEGIKKGGVFGPSGLTFPSFTPVKSNGSLECLELDLADFNSISRFVDDFTSRENKLDVLFANAGVMASAEGQYTKQGYTLQFGTNCLGHQRLISLLLPLLLSGSSSGSPSRIISLSSAGHSMAPSKGFDPPSVLRPQNYDQEHPKKGPNEYSKWVEYGQSKWGNVAIVKYLHWLYGPEQGKARKSVKGEKVAKGEVISIAIHPGMVATNLARHLSLTEVILKKIPWFASLITRPAEIGASNQLWAATCPDDRARHLSGEYVVPFQHVGVARPDLENPRKIQELWDWCEEQGKRHV